MGTDQKLDDVQFIELQKKLVEGFENVKARVQRLQGIIDTIETGGVWQGLGAATFNQKQVEINESLQNMGRRLAEFVESMHVTLDIKDSTEDKIRAEAQKIDVQYGGSKSALDSY